MRKTKEELDVIKQKYGVNRLFSWSARNCFHNSQYEYFLKYIKKIKPDNENSIYGTLGNSIHNILEDFYLKKIPYEEVINKFKDEWFLNYDIANLKFNRNDESKNKIIAEKYLYDLEHFCKHFIPLEYPCEVERFIPIKIGEFLLQGYIDIIWKENDNIIIGDFKTSTLYTGDKKDNEIGQLCIYAEGIHQQFKIPYNKIKIAWNFLKYCNITIVQKNGQSKIRQIERCKTGESIKAKVKIWLNEFKYTKEEIQKYIQLLIDYNIINVLPKEIQSKFKIEDCWVYTDITNELIKNWVTTVNNDLYEINQKETRYQEDLDENIWFDSNENVEKQSFYFANLCGYSANIHKPYKLYLDKYNAEKNGNVFSGVGKDTSNDKNDNQLNNNINNDINNEDFGWLNLI